MVSVTTDAIHYTFFQVNSNKKPLPSMLGIPRGKVFATKDLKEVGKIQKVSEESIFVINVNS